MSVYVDDPIETGRGRVKMSQTHCPAGHALEEHGARRKSGEQAGNRYCRLCEKARYRRWYDGVRGDAVRKERDRQKTRDPERSKRQWRESRTRQLLKATGGRPRPKECEVCGGPGGKRGICLDHSHAEGKFRGWLCMQCNCALGHAKDSPELLRKLADYLEGRR